MKMYSPFYLVLVTVIKPDRSTKKKYKTYRIPQNGWKLEIFNSVTNKSNINGKIYKT